MGLFLRILLPLGKKPLSERHRQRNKGNHCSLGSLTDLRLLVTFEPFPTHEKQRKD